MTSRRPFLLAGLSLLGGCGFHPLLAPGAGGNSSVIARLRTIYVPVMPDRAGQLFREALQSRLYGSDASAAKRYELSAPLALNIEGLGIQSDSSTSRFRITGSTAWTLVDLDKQRAVTATGFARLLDGYDNVDQQYLATAFESEAATARIANNLAERVVQQIAAFFDRTA